MTARRIPGVNLRNRKGPNHPSWRGGRNMHPSGYVRVSVPGHPRGSGQSNYVLEHLLIVERVLGRYLPVSAHVHHVDGNKANNVPANLVVCQDAAYHRLLHKRTAAYLACGDANALCCARCGGYENQADITVTRGGQSYHRACNAQASRDRLRRIRGEADLTPLSRIVPGVVARLRGEA